MSGNDTDKKQFFFCAICVKGVIPMGQEMTIEQFKAHLDANRNAQVAKTRDSQDV